MKKTALILLLIVCFAFSASSCNLISGFLGDKNEDADIGGESDENGGSVTDSGLGESGGNVTGGGSGESGGNVTGGGSGESDGNVTDGGSGESSGNASGGESGSGDHTHSYSSVAVTAPTCTAVGYTTYACSCGDSYRDDETEATGHTYGEWTTVTDFTCTTDGEKRRECENCDDYESEVLSAQHKFEDGICTVCHAEYVSEGLEYFSIDGSHYVVTGIGRCKDTDIIIPNMYNNLPVLAIRDKAFQNCTDITSVRIPYGVTSIGTYAFSNCKGLTSVVISGSVTDIGSYAFSNCTSLTSVTVPDSITSIGESTFSNCTALEYNIYDNTYYLGNTDNPHVILVKAIDTSITSCEINPNTKHIYASAFSACSNLTSIIIPNGVLSIGNYAFSDCISLSDISIPDSVTRFGIYGVFSRCTALEYNTYDNAYYLGNDSNPYVLLVKPIDASITSCEVNESTRVIMYGAFRSCSSITSISVPFVGASKGENNYFEGFFGYIFGYTSDRYGDFYYNDYNYKINIPSSLESVTVTGITDICGYSFSACSSITSVTIGDGVTSIAEYAFYGCSALKSVIIGDRVTSIGNHAFYNCSKLSEVTIGNSVTSIGAYAFYTCTALTSVKFDNPNGWWYATSSIDTNVTYLSSDALSDSSSAARNLKAYADYYWNRS